MQATSFDNPNHIQLPATSGPGGAQRVIDSSTYSKRERRSRTM